MAGGGGQHETQGARAICACVCCNGGNANVVVGATLPPPLVLCRWLLRWLGRLPRPPVAVRPQARPRPLAALHHPRPQAQVAPVLVRAVGMVQVTSLRWLVH
jgi:hypothetical protein